MKTRKHRVPLLSGGSRSLLAALVAGVVVEAGAASIGSSFSYQGRLTVDGRPADGHFDLTFVLRDSATRGNQVAGPLTNTDVSVSQGLFTTALDFGLDAFEGSPRWLEIGVRAAGSTVAYTLLEPLQPVLAVPYAVRAHTASQVLGGIVSDPGFIGTTIASPLELFVNRDRVLRLEPTSTLGAVNLIAGSPANQVAPGVLGATIAGGGTGDSPFGGGPSPNVVRGNYGTVGGGSGNTIEPSPYATISGGANNIVSAFASIGTISGGIGNHLGSFSRAATIGGGEDNQTGDFAELATISGGSGNVLGRFCGGGTISGGVDNRVGNDGAHAVIAGGEANSIEAGSASAAIGGGERNTNGAVLATISGGAANLVLSNATFSTISGGEANSIGLNADAATIGGGRANAVRFAGFTAFIGGGANNSIVAGHEDVIGGGRGNHIDGGVNYSTIGGGLGNRVNSEAVDGTIAGGTQNSVGRQASFATIAGGNGNLIGSESYNCTIGGGGANVTGFRANNVTVAGGAANQISDVCYNATIGGGSGNLIFSAGGFEVRNGTIAGGEGNQIQAFGDHATIGGGNGNIIGPRSAGAVVAGGVSNRVAAPFSVVPGGYLNVAAGTNSFAGGRRAQALHSGAFVWADSEDEDFASTGTNQFLIRAAGGVGIGTASPEFLLHVNGSAGKPGGGAWSTASDARLKKEIRPLEGALQRLMQIHGVTFEYKDPAAIHELDGRRTGMIAQEVETVFPDWVETGRDGMKRLSIRGFEALAVEALRDLRAEKDKQISERDEQITTLTRRLDNLERVVTDLTRDRLGSARHVDE